jgi:hypothetical protein
MEGVAKASLTVFSNMGPHEPQTNKMNKVNVFEITKCQLELFKPEVRISVYCVRPPFCLQVSCSCDGLLLLFWFIWVYFLFIKPQTNKMNKVNVFEITKCQLELLSSLCIHWRSL